MLDATTRQQCFELYPQLRQDPVAAAVFEHANRVKLPAGTTVFSQGAACQNFLLVLRGSLRVFSRSETGKEALLYRVRPGDTCVLTTSCLLGGQNYPAEGITEDETEAVAIPYGRFQEFVMKSTNFREYVFNSFGRRLVDLISLIEGMHSGTVQARLAAVLLQRGGSGGSTISTTHQDLAFELGSAREVVSRQLKQMEKAGYLKLSRGKIQLLDLAALEIVSSALET